MQHGQEAPLTDAAFTAKALAYLLRHQAVCIHTLALMQPQLAPHSRPASRSKQIVVEESSALPQQAKPHLQGIAGCSVKVNQRRKPKHSRVDHLRRAHQQALEDICQVAYSELRKTRAAAVTQRGARLVVARITTSPLLAIVKAMLPDSVDGVLDAKVCGSAMWV